MSQTSPTLHMLCGKVAAGKSTLAAELSKSPGTVKLSEDAWLSALFGEEMHTGADFVRYSDKLRGIMGPHVVSLLQSGLSVVLDFAANTTQQRAWMREIFETAEAAHVLHVLTPTDEVCLARLRARNAKGEHPFAPTEAQFHQFARHFVPPAAEEGFNVIRYDEPKA